MKNSVAILETTGEAIPGLDVLATIGLACSLTIAVGKHLEASGDDGGRLNFGGVLSHALARISSCVTPHSAAPAEVPCIQATKLNPAWANQVVDSSVISNWTTPYQEGTYFGTFKNSSLYYPDTAQTYYPEYNHPYIVNMPEQSWLHGGTLTFATVKVYCDSEALHVGESQNAEELYALASVVYSAGGNTVSATVLRKKGGGTNHPAPYSTPWCSSSNKSEINSDFASQVYNAVFQCELSSQPSRQLQYVVPPLLQSIVQSIEMVAGLGTQPVSTAKISWTEAVQYDTGTAPSVAIQNNGTVIECHDHRVTNISHLFWNYGSITTIGTNVTRNKTNDDRQYETGSWPALSTNPNGNDDILDNHNDSSSIKWETGTVDGSKKEVSFGNATTMSEGDHPSLFVGGDNVTVALFASGNNELSYNTGNFSNGSFNPYQSEWQAVDYTQGDYPTVLRSSNSVLEVHNNAQAIWFQVGTLSNDYKSISWGNGPYPFMIGGSHPHLAYFGSGRVVLTYDNDNKLYAAVGKIVNGVIQWFITNLEICTGQYPAICSVPKLTDTFVMCYNDSYGNLKSTTGVVTFPA